MAQGHVPSFDRRALMSVTSPVSSSTSSQQQQQPQQWTHDNNVLICGDFNSSPASDLLRYTYNGSLSLTNCSRHNLDGHHQANYFQYRRIHHSNNHNNHNYGHREKSASSSAAAMQQIVYEPAIPIASEHDRRERIHESLIRYGTLFSHGLFLHLSIVIVFVVAPYRMDSRDDNLTVHHPLQLLSAYEPHRNGIYLYLTPYCTHTID
jgi:hypothetical protein